VYRTGTEGGRDATGHGHGVAELFAHVFPEFRLSRSGCGGLGDRHRGGCGGRVTTSTAVLWRPLARSVFVVRVLFKVHQSQRLCLFDERFSLFIG